MEEFKELLKKAGKTIVKTIVTIFSPIIIIMCIILVLLSAFVYFITIDYGTYKEDDWSSAQYGASTYVNGATVNSDGTISNSTTAQELWDKMIENGSDVDEYLDNPEQLAKLMKAEMITKYPDTRSNPDEELDWESIINGDSLQGIIKFKRADENGNTSTMTYVDPSTFQGYIDEYNSTGSEEAKQAALSHFTLKRTSSSTSISGINYNGPDLCWPTTSTIITSSFGYREAPTEGASTNHKGIDIGVDSNSDVYACEDGTVKAASYDSSAGNYVVIDHGNGYKSRYLHNNTIKVSVGQKVEKGDIIAASGNTGTSTGPHLHFEILYNDEPINPLSFKYNNGMGDGTGGFGNDDSETETEDEEEDSETTTSTASSVETPVSGDGYDLEYTSSAGITYKQFKQYKGTYASNTYWNYEGTISDSGCGPTSVAILASGLTNLDYTPANTAQEMLENYGDTSAVSLKGEMDSLGMTSEIIYEPTAEQIQDNLRNGKVMLVLVTPDTIFTDRGHIMALVDINEQGQVYISNPASDTVNGWMDISEIMKGCSYIVTTDAGATGIAQSSNNSNYVAVVATWRQVDTTVTTNDPNVEAYETHNYTMTTTDVNYEVMVEPYTMPFNFLWALLVCGDGNKFVLELADLVYNSTIEITVHDNLTINTDIDKWNYTLTTKAEVGTATITGNCGGFTEEGTVNAHTHEPWGEDETYETTKTIITQTNTINTAVTKADVWIVDYENQFTYSTPASTTTPGSVTVDDTEYESAGTEESSFTCDEIEAEKTDVGNRAREKYRRYSTNTTTTNTSNLASTTTASYVPQVTYDIDVTAEYFTKYIDIIDTTTDTTETKKYIEGTPSIKEKTDPDSTEPNFVTIFNDPKYARNSSSIRSAAEWLFELIETKENNIPDYFLDLMKYLLYKATGVDYGVTEFDFTLFYPGTLTSVGANDYIVHIDKSPQKIVIDDVETLKIAFAGSGGAGSDNLVAYADDFLRLQEEYRVNAVFAAAVTTAECGVGTNLQIGGNNWFSIRNPSGGWMKYSSPSESIEAFCNQIARLGYYFTEGNYTVRSIGMIYCEDADAPGGWIESVLMYMTNMYNAAGIDVSSFSANGDFLEVAKQCHDYLVENQYYYSSAANKYAGKYVGDGDSTGSSIPKPYPEEGNYIDCSAYVTWVLYEYGYKDLGPVQESTRTLLGLAQKKGWTVKSGSEAIAGDIVLIPGYHTAIYAGNGQFYDCGATSLIRSSITTWKPDSGYTYAITVTKP